ncbi:MAG TPA: hypothetical protein VGM30_04675 [Puia sp.]|jgi:hypothetical protein
MKKTFKFVLKIDDEHHSLSAKDGLPFQKLGELLVALFKAIDPNTNSKCTVKEIVDGSYGVAFDTQDEAYHTNFEIVHRNIQENPIDELDDRQRDYANCLKKVLGGKCFIKAENDEGKEIASITELDRTTNVDIYYSTETLYGVLSQIGSTTIASSKKYIYLDGVQYRISVTKDQDAELKPYYSSHKLRVKVRQKRSIVDGHVISADMLSFTVVEESDLIDTLKQIGYVDFALIKDAHTMDEIVDRIYGDK